MPQYSVEMNKSKRIAYSMQNQWIFGGYIKLSEYLNNHICRPVSHTRTARVNRVIAPKSNPERSRRSGRDNTAGEVQDLGLHTSA